MNDRLLAQQFAAIFLGTGFPVLKALFASTAGSPSIFAAQEGAIVNPPTLAISGEYEPYLNRRKGTLSFEIRTRLGDEDQDGGGNLPQQKRLEELFKALLGAQGADSAGTRANQSSAKAFVKAALAVLGRVDLVDYGPARDAVSADREGDDLRTVLILNVVWRFLP